MAHRRNNKGSGLVRTLLILVIVLMLAVTGMLAYVLLGMGKDDEPTVQSAPGEVTLPNLAETNPETEPETVPETEAPKELVTTIRLGAMGDLLMHEPFFLSKYQAVSAKEDGTFDFSTVFQFIKDPLSRLDFAVANLETTLCGSDNGYPYQGYPHFNCPDEIASDAKTAGFDMLLTANNHSYDTTLVGLKRTLETVRGAGLKTLGTMADAQEPKYTVEDIGGVKLGMMAFTYADRVTSDGRPVLNKNSSVKEAGIVNFFTYNNLNAFYSQVETYLAEMKAAGAENTVLFLHWGTEYKTEASDTQKKMAQKLCDLGVDVIIGGHPHVIEPIDLLTSNEDPEHKTVVIYSLGNAASNQRRNLLKQQCPTGHSEDGVLFTVTFQKWSDGSVNVSAVDALPTWVNKYRTEEGTLIYTILPLDDSARSGWQEAFGLTDEQFALTEESYDRTLEILGPGLQTCRSYFEGQE